MTPVNNHTLQILLLEKQLEIINEKRKHYQRIYNSRSKNEIRDSKLISITPSISEDILAKLQEQEDSLAQCLKLFFNGKHEKISAKVIKLTA